ncbi:modifier of mdg4-like isoform X2 [Anopheles aquasalis]|uniref:modifier of mdg4-like isoform X2 n=1 Tax=Anopheles aquasalis TaxID=42839 RepID=UPI00215B56E8|nr:modifier of mdg4-like isoform X2 [Anopheles aquasalis]
MADDEQFSLCWNNFNSNLSAGFHDSLVQGDLVDVTLAAEGHLVKAHRLILSVCSPYFRKMFMQMPVNQHAFIFLKDVSHSVLKDLIQFMYCGEVNVKQEALPGFISTAEALQIKGLTETGDSAPPQASPAKEIPSTPAPVSISTANTVPPRGKSQRTRVQSFKLESEESGDDKIVQIQTPASHHHSASASQQVQQVQQLHVASGQKRVLGQRHVQASQITKRAKISLSSADVLDPSDNTTQIQTVQIIKQLPSQPAEPEYVDLAMEAINAKPEPDYAEEPAEIETVEAETEQDQSLTENEQTADQEQEHGDDGDQYVDDDAYGELSKYEESYFTEAEDAKPGASGFGESYASDGTSNEQTSQETQFGKVKRLNPIPDQRLKQIARERCNYIVIQTRQDEEESGEHMLKEESVKPEISVAKRASGRKSSRSSQLQQSEGRQNDEDSVRKMQIASKSCKMKTEPPPQMVDDVESGSSKLQYIYGRVKSGRQLYEDSVSEHEVQSKPPWSHTHYKQSQRIFKWHYKQSQRSGKELLVINGITFFRNRQRNNKQYWKCNQYYKCKCPCMAIVDDKIPEEIRMKHNHNHDVPLTSYGGKH